jgi:HK97 family phage portal protein
MGFLDRLLGRKETRTLENPAIPISSDNVLQYLGLVPSATGLTVTVENALGIPAYWAGVNFLSGTMAGLPCQAFKKTDKGREQIKGGIYDILHDAVNDGMSSFEWRRYCFDQLLTGGRCFTWIERNAANKVVNLWPLEPNKVTIQRVAGIKTYKYKEGNRTTVYDASEIIDIPFMLKADGLSHRSPISQCRDALALSIASTEYGSKFFQNGGIPPFVITGAFNSPGAVQRASDDVMKAVTAAAKEKRSVLALPTGHEIKQIGVDPDKSQLVELKRFGIEEVARILGLPPIFLQDLTNGTFSNTEQQDLFLVKHRISSLCNQFEQEVNLKLFGRGSKQYVEMNVDGLLRGDFKTRMDGYAQGIQHGVYRPNEARQMENLPDDPDYGDKLYMQGAMAPIDKLGQQQPLPLPAPKAGANP